MADSRFITNPGSQSFVATAPFCEPYAVPDIDVSGFRLPEAVGDDLYRLTAYVRQTSVHDGQTEFMINARLLLSLPTLTSLSLMLPGSPARGMQQ